MSLKQRLEGLAEGPLPDWNRAERAMCEGHLEAGRSLMDQDEPGASIAFITSGWVRLQYRAPDGRQHTKAVVGPGQTAASLTALNGGRARFGAESLTPVRFITLDYEVMRALMGEHLAWERVARGLLMDLALRKEQREYDLLALTAEQRWLQLCAERPDLLAAVAQFEIAALIGVTPVALSRIKARMRLRGGPG